jgi:hypothetical protein
MADADDPNQFEMPERGLDPEFLRRLLPLCREANAALPDGRPIPPSDGPGAHLRRWRRLTGR